MKTKKAIEILHKMEVDEAIIKISMKDFNEAVAAGKKALMCWLWMSGAIKAGMSDEEIMKVVRQGFLEASETDEGRELADNN